MTFATDTQINKPTLKLGSKGEAVKELQSLLLKYRMYVSLDSSGACVFGTPAVIDGIFGNSTKEAVEAFQGKMFLTQDGVVGNQTWRSLLKNAPVGLPVIKRNSTGELVKRLQQRLAIGGYEIGAVDGNFGAKTEAIVKKFQLDSGLQADGVVGDGTWSALSSQISTIAC